MNNKLFVTKLSRTFTVEQLRALFEQVGQVKEAKRPRDHESGELRTFGFVTMATEEQAAEAIRRFDGMLLEGQPIVVKLAEDRPPSATPAPAAPRPAAPGTPAPALPRTTDFAWAQRLEVMNQALAGRGAATTAKTTLVGRPDRVEVRGGLVVVAMEHTMKQTGFPKGVPTPPAAQTMYVVYIGAKQWKKVEEAIRDPEDVLIIEGQGMFDPDIPGVALFATNVTTKLLQQASRPKAAEDDAGQEAPTAE